MLTAEEMKSIAAKVRQVLLELMVPKNREGFTEEEIKNKTFQMECLISAFREESVNYPEDKNYPQLDEWLDTFAFKALCLISHVLKKAYEDAGYEGYKHEFSDITEFMGYNEGFDIEEPEIEFDDEHRTLFVDGDLMTPEEAVEEGVLFTKSHLDRLLGMDLKKLLYQEEILKQLLTPHKN